MPFQRMDARSPRQEVKRSSPPPGEIVICRSSSDGLDHVGLLGLTLEVLLVIAVAEHAEVAGHAAVGVDRDARQDLLALVEAKAIQVEVR